jgi:predicted nucleotidyltransferase
MVQRDLKLSTNDITDELIKYIIDKIASEIHPEKIILFGSHAMGTATKDSDLDLFIVKDDKVENREIRRKIDLLLLGRRFGVDIIVRKPQEVEANLKDNNPFYVYHIFRDGKVVYDREKEITC